MGRTLEESLKSGFLGMETRGCLTSQFTLSMNGAGACGGNSSAELLGEPDFVSSICPDV